MDLERRRIGLTLENPQVGRTMSVGEETLTIGQMRPGKVEDIKQFGIFVSLSPTQTGLVHVSKIPFKGGPGNRMKEMWDTYPPGSEVQVIIEQVQGGRISLALPGAQTEDDEDYRKYLEDKDDSDGGSFGGLDNAFDGLEL